MGYTHYWYRQKAIDRAVFGQIKRDFGKLLPVLEEQGVSLADGMGNGKPVLTATKICFNGTKSESYETFDFSQLLRLRSWEEPAEDGTYFQFCKTAERPYDLAVTAFLIIAKHYLKQQLTVSSDGDAADWAAARQICKEHLGLDHVELNFTHY
ncbi:hypothetical protein [Paenibacillus sp. 1P07SE]|uniref:hypothetical protein n=1 Tax=Paenibacillus sp. 1P07SE TaxID=3132209 RepID=UPI0039A6D5F5